MCIGATCLSHIDLPHSCTKPQFILSIFARCLQMNNQTVYKHSVKAGCLFGCLVALPQPDTGLCQCQWPLPVLQPHSALSDRLTDGLQRARSRLSPSRTRRNAMTSDGNLNMQGQQSGSGAAGRSGKMEQRKQRGGGDVKMVLNGLGEQEGRIDLGWKGKCGTSR